VVASNTTFAPGIGVLSSRDNSTSYSCLCVDECA
jgi:hypothetical protein